MVINWTKIIILVIIIAAFTGIIVGIVLAFRAQCPDGKIYDKNCKKCITKCPDGYNLPSKDGQIDCDSDKCQIDCGDQCRLDDNTCGQNCDEECCDSTKICFGGYCQIKNCPKDNPQIYCPDGFQCINNGGTYSCSSGTNPCDTKNTVPCGGKCCPTGEYCIKDDNDNYSCCPNSTDKIADNDKCCPKSRFDSARKSCCDKNSSQLGKDCCPDIAQCGTKDKPICCDSTANQICKEIKDVKQCVINCPGSRNGYCPLYTTRDGKKIPYACVTNGDKGTCTTDPCEWGAVNYNPLRIGEDVDNPITLCKFSEKAVTNCDFDQKYNIQGVWRKNWSYPITEETDIGYIPSSDSQSIKQLCFSSNVTSNNKIQCDISYCGLKLIEDGDGDIEWDPNTGICRANISCNSDPDFIKQSSPGFKAKIPDNCLESGICCNEVDTSGSGGKCGPICLPKGQYCLLSGNDRYNDSITSDQICDAAVKNGRMKIPSDGILGYSSTNPDYCKTSTSCNIGWKSDNCIEQTCDNVNCSDMTCECNNTYVPIPGGGGGYYQCTNDVLSNNCDSSPPYSNCCTNSCGGDGYGSCCSCIKK